MGNIGRRFLRHSFQFTFVPAPDYGEVGLRKALIMVLLGLILQGCAPDPPCATYPPPRLVASAPHGRELNRFVQDSLPYRFSGVVLVAQKGRVVLHGAYGFADPRNCTPSDTTNAYWIGSLSKQFAAAAVMRLAEDTLLDVSASIADYVPGVPADKRDITLHHLMTHTSGLPNLYSVDGVSERDQAVATILGQDLERRPGMAYGYSNEAYSLIAAIIETASGSTFETYLNEELLQPLGLTGVALAGDSARWNSLDVAKRAIGAPKSGPPQNWESDWGYKGATGVLATASDLRTWFDAIWGGHVLNQAGTDALFSPQIGTRREGLSYGYGWYHLVLDSGRVSTLHTGDDDFIGHNSSLRWVQPDSLFVLVLSNSGYFEDQSVASQLADDLTERALSFSR